MKKNLSIILSVILVFTMMLTACGSEKAPETTAAATVATTVATTAPVETTPVLPLELTQWDMSASTWSSPNGATIHITATPNYYAEGQTADFTIRLDDEDVTTVPCQWDGTSYTASADLNAGNGYCYYVVLTAVDGTVTEVAVNTPAEPINEAFINLEASLNSYCSIIVEESAIENGQLTLSGGNVQVQAPVITNEGETISCQEATLVLSFNGEVLEQKALTLTQTETAGLFEAALDGIVFSVPEMEAGQLVELMLNVTLTNDHALSAYGGNWQYSEEGLMTAVG